MKINLILAKIALIIGLSVVSLATQAVEILRWERVPLAVPLVVGQERIIFVNQNVRVGVPRAINDKLRVQSIGGAIYLLAKEQIEPTRLQLQNAQTGEIILIDIAAMPPQKDQAALEPAKIVMGAPTPARYGSVAKATPKATAPAAPSSSSDDDDEEEQTPPQRHETPAPVVLTRYAAQMLYAPLRTVEPVDGIAQVKIDRRTDLSTVAPTLPVRISMLGAWRLDDYWVTALKVRNQSGQRLTLDPRELMGDFVTATFQHSYLGSMGDATDTTTLYLVTRGHGIAQAVVPAISQVDPRTTGGRP